MKIPVKQKRWAEIAHLKGCRSQCLKETLSAATEIPSFV